MIPSEAVIYSSSFWQEAQCLLVANYAGLRVHRCLTERESEIRNPAMGRFFGENWEDGSTPIPFTVIVGCGDLIGEAFRTFVRANAVMVIDAGAIAFKLINPEEDVPPICPAIEAPGVSDDRICPEEYQCLTNEDRQWVNLDAVRCRYDNLDEAACPHRPDFDAVRKRRDDIIQSIQRENREKLWAHAFAFREELRTPAKLEKAVHDHNRMIYLAMLECLEEERRSLSFKDVARLLEAKGIRSKSRWPLRANNLQKTVESLGKVTEWRRRNQLAGWKSRYRNASWRHLHSLDKLFAILLDPWP